METPPPLQRGYVRLALLLQGRALTPADLAKATGLEPEQLGHIFVADDHAIVDVLTEHGKQAREGLDTLGPVQVLADAAVSLSFKWLKIHVGRNHGITAKQLRRILERVDSGPIGRFHVKNTHVMVGIREDRFDDVVAGLNRTKINGMLPRAGAPEPDETPKTSAAFTG